MMTRSIWLAVGRRLIGMDVRLFASFLDCIGNEMIAEQSLNDECLIQGVLWSMAFL